MSKIQEALKRLQQSGEGRPLARHSNSDELSPMPSKVARPVRQHSDDVIMSSLSTNANTLVVDRDALRREGLIAPHNDAELLAKQYRAIKRPLIRHAFGKKATKVEDGNLIMVTSSMAGEGKTFTSINLALSMAQERDHSVVLVDADVAKPHVSDIFGVSDELGLLDLLENDNLSLQSLVIPTDIDHLYILPAGHPRHNATELLASKRMESITHMLAGISEQPMIIFDSPPLLQTSEASVVAMLVGQVLMVVSAGQTSQHAVQNALAMLGEETAVNLVLNQATNVGDDFHYGAEYSYGSGAHRSAEHNVVVSDSDASDDEHEEGGEK